MRPPRNRPSSSTALAVIEPTSTDVALPVELVTKARKLARNARSKNTLKAYALWWKKFARWCEANGREALPAQISTVIGYLTWLHDGQPGVTHSRQKQWPAGYQVSINTMQMALAAIKFRHKTKGYKLDGDDPDLQNVWAGIRREVASRRMVRKAAAITPEQLRALIEMLRPDVPREACNRAIVALGMTATLRRSEIVGLDWAQPGTEEDENRLGYLVSDDDGLKIILMRSKASQDVAEDVVIPEKYASTIVEAIRNWVKLANIQPGTPLFRAVKGNSGYSSVPQSGYLGVSWMAMGKPKGTPWRVQVYDKGKSKQIGTLFADPREAHLARCAHTGEAPSEPWANMICDRRMPLYNVGVIIKQMLKRWIVAERKRKGAKKLAIEELNAEVAKYSSHSMRAGGITAMARAGIPAHEIKIHSRHKDEGMVSEYIRAGNKVEKSPVRSFGF